MELLVFFLLQFGPRIHIGLFLKVGDPPGKEGGGGGPAGSPIPGLTKKPDSDEHLFYGTTVPDMQGTGFGAVVHHLIEIVIIVGAPLSMLDFFSFPSWSLSWSTDQLIHSETDIQKMVAPMLRLRPLHGGVRDPWPAALGGGQGDAGHAILWFAFACISPSHSLSSWSVCFSLSSSKFSKSPLDTPKTANWRFIIWYRSISPVSKI